MNGGLGGMQVSADRIAHMFSPAQCAYCFGLYDLGSVTVTVRYADCSMWRSPCCGITVDDRGETGWKSKQDYYRLNADGSRRRS